MPATSPRRHTACLPCRPPEPEIEKPTEDNTMQRRAIVSLIATTAALWMGGVQAQGELNIEQIVAFLLAEEFAAFAQG